MYELIKSKLDWVHDTDGYCIAYTVEYWSASWSRGKYWIVTGQLANGGVVDLGQFETYRSEYEWLGGCVGTWSK